MNSNEEVCRFCLKEINGIYLKKIGEPVRYILAELCITVNLDISENPVMCTDCSEHIQKAFSLKKACVHTENCLSTYLNSQCRKVIDLQEVYLQINHCQSIENGNVCRFCMNLTSEECSQLLNISIEDLPAMKDLLEQHYPELNLSSVKDSYICNACCNILTEFLDFILKSKKLEEAIEKYIKMEETDKEGKINLSTLQPFLDKSLIKSEINHLNIDISEAKQNCYGELQLSIKNEETIKNEEVEIKHEEIDNESYQNNMLRACEDIPRPDYDDEIRNVRKPSTLTKPKYTRGPLNRKLSSKTATLYECGYENCSFKTKYKGALVKHFLTHKQPSELTMYRCEGENCSYVTKYKHHLKEHMLCHANGAEGVDYKCEYENCSYKTRHKYQLGRHSLIHKNSSKLAMYKCESENCFFETKRKAGLKSHMLRHMNRLEGKMYVCEYENCLYKARYKCLLIPHSVIHKDPAELTMYKCSVEGCSFETKRKGNLRIHMLNHQNRSYNRDTDSLHTSTYKCNNENCSFKTKYKYSLMKHSLLHKNLSEIKTYKCGSEGCSFETRYKGNLEIHVMAHQSPSYKCDVENCLFKTKYKSVLKNHSLVHKKSSELTMYKCGSEGCLFETKHKNSLRVHMSIHFPSRVKTYTCKNENCSYKTRYKFVLKKHMEIHQKYRRTSAESGNCLLEMGKKSRNEETIFHKHL